MSKTNKYNCNSCKTDIDFNDNHLYEDCLYIQLVDLQEKNKKLTNLVKFWKENWFEQREATGRMAWEIPKTGYIENQADLKKFGQITYSNGDRIWIDNGKVKAILTHDNLFFRYD